MVNTAVQKTIQEQASDIAVIRTADVVVVGGGPAGIGAAVAAARAGADTVLVERYGHLGGMATGGLVILIPHMSGDTGEQQIMGICQEWIDRLDVLGGAIHPDRSELGSRDKASIDKWKDYFSFVVNDRIRQSVYLDPELLKCVLNDMIEESGVKLYLHTWGCKAITEADSVQGVIFESKAGRQAILGKVVIDTTGDGDIMASAGAGFDGGMDGELRSAMLAVVFRLGNVDFDKFCEFRTAHPEHWKDITSRIYALGDFRLLPYPTNRNDVMWVNNWVPGRSCLDLEDITWTEVNVRKVMRRTQAILKREVPGFADCFVLDTASQLGTRGSRRLEGEYKVSLKDISSGKTYPDTITFFPSLQLEEKPLIHIPYRSLVPKNMEGLLVAGRCYSSDGPANNMTNLIPHCVAMGEAAGAAAALAIDAGVGVRHVDIRDLQKHLRQQGVPLPDSVPADVEVGVD
jgi:2-polyprenyl-6-methoxyphenol hydroxylase-like FAD-dependent oxidoreductase